MKYLHLPLIAMVAALALTGCKEDKDAEVSLDAVHDDAAVVTDKEVKDLGDKMEEMADDVSEEAQDMAEDAEDAIDDAIDDAKDAIDEAMD